MKKTELVEQLSLKAGVSKKDAEKVLNAFVETMGEVLANGDKISLKGFGTFEVRERGERVGHNPKTGETMTIAASKAPAFKASSSLKTLVNK